MDAGEITRVLEDAHPEGVSWESHLALVDEMETWNADRLHDFQESLFEHILQGTWQLSWGGPPVSLPNGMTIAADQVVEHLTMLRDILPAMESQDDGSERMAQTLAGFRLTIEVLEGQGTPVLEKVVPAPGHIAIPLRDSFAVEWAESVIRHDGRPSRRRVLSIVNEESLTNVVDFVRVLRAAPWAIFRSTGTRPKGILPSREEERHASGGDFLFRTTRVLERDGDRIESVSVEISPSLDYTSARQPSIAPVALALSARVLGPATFMQLGDAPGTRLPSGVIVDEWPTRDEPPSALLTDARALLSGTSKRRAVPPLPAETFWSLIDLLVGDARNAETLIDALSRGRADDIPRFAESLADALFALDRPELMNDPEDDAQIPMSEDVFLYFRCTVVARGRAGFERVLREGVLREREWDDGGSGESLLNVVPLAYERTTGKTWNHATHVSYETGSNREAWGSARRPQSRGWDGWMIVRSRATTDAGEIDTVRHWSIDDAEEARAAHLAAESARAGHRDVVIVDDLRRSSHVSAGILGAPIDWVRLPPP